MEYRIYIRASIGSDLPYSLFINGQRADPRKAFVSHDLRRHPERSIPLVLPLKDWAVHILDNELANEVKAFRIEEIEPSIAILSLPFRLTWSPFIERLYIGEIRGERKIAAAIVIKHDQWANPYTVPEFISALQEAAEKGAHAEYSDIRAFGPDLKFGTRDSSGWIFGIALTVRSTANSINQEALFYGDRLKVLCEAAARAILASRKDALVTFFDFPSHLKASCEQYLVYFIQFLEDLGIGADSEIKQHAGQVMFSVTPKDGESALSLIKEALEVYLSLPMNKEFARAASHHSDIAVAQLRANIFFLQSQLELARAIIEAKDATIQALDLTAFQQRQLLTSLKQEVEDHLSKPDSSDQEPLIGDFVHVTSLEGKGFRVDLAALLRHLKRSLGVSKKAQGNEGQESD